MLEVRYLLKKEPMAKTALYSSPYGLLQGSFTEDDYLCRLNFCSGKTDGLPDIGTVTCLTLYGTEFCHRVWQELLALPRNKTLSYSELARNCNLKGVRSVAAAVAKNPIAYLVPCHLIIRKDCSLGGYRWGAALKKQILEREANAKF